GYNFLPNKVKVTIRTKRNHVIFAIADIQEIPILSIIHKSIDE
ncbi:12387_t:CDS:1, partial [Gigaspora rosea]